MTDHFFWLTDDQFVRLESHLPTDTRGKARVDDRRVISGIVHVLKSGLPLGGRARDLRAAQDALQSVRQGHLAEHLSGSGFGGRPSGAGADRFISGEGASLCRRGKRGDGRRRLVARVALAPRKSTP